MFYLTYAKKVLLIFLPKFKNSNNIALYPALSKSKFSDEAKAYKRLIKVKGFRDSILALLLALSIVGISFLLAKLFKNSSLEVAVILLVTTLSIIASLFKNVRNLQNTYQLGMYLILVFSFTVASMVDLDELLVESMELVYYVLFVIVFTFTLHFLLSAIFRIDADSFLIVSTALIMSPPFVPVVSQAINNRYLLVPGLLIGLLGYVLGNYLGVFLYLVLEKLF